MLPGIAGGASGYNAFGDVLKTTVDGTSLADLWNEFVAVLKQLNDQRDTMRSLLSFSTARPAEEVARVGSLTNFEDATEYGEPVGARLKSDVDKRGAGFRFRDLATRFTWMYLSEATAEQTRALYNLVLEADHRQVFDAIMGRLFRGNVNGTNPEGFTIFGLYNNDGEVPPDYACNVPVRERRRTARRSRQPRRGQAPASATRCPARLRAARSRWSPAICSSTSGSARGHKAVTAAQASASMPPMSGR